MDALLSSFLLVAAGEFGDKTQLLAIVLAARFRKPAAILAGILVATLANHALATAFGTWVAGLASPALLRYVLAATFVGFGLWILVPDKEDDEAGKDSRYGAFLTTVVTFFLAEMGDKTQLATVALGARFPHPVLVTVGTTLGMMATNGLAVVFGERLTRAVPLPWVRRVASVLFVATGVAVYFGVG